MSHSAKRIVFEVHCTNPQIEGPAFAVLDVDQAFTHLAAKMRENAQWHGLDETRKAFEQTVWLDADEHCPENELLAVRPNDFWIVSFCGFNAGAYETTPISFDAYYRFLASDSSVLLHGFAVDELTPEAKVELDRCLSGLSAPKPYAPTPVLQPTKQIVIEVDCTNEYGEGPGLAIFNLNQTLIDLVRKHRDIVDANDGIRFLSHYPITWEDEDECRIRGEMLVVSTDYFFFSAHPKHASYEVETHQVWINDLEKYMADERTVIPIGDDEDGLLERAQPLLDQLNQEGQS